MLTAIFFVRLKTFWSTTHFLVDLSSSGRILIGQKFRADCTKILPLSSFCNCNIKMSEESASFKKILDQKLKKSSKMVESNILHQISTYQEDVSTLQQVHRSCEHTGLEEKVSGENRYEINFGTIWVF